MVSNTNEHATNKNFASTSFEYSALNYARNHWGKNATKNKLDSLEYSLNSNFITWYHNNYYKLPLKYRNLTNSNMPFLMKIYQNESPKGKLLLSNIANYEMNKQHKNNLNITHIVNNRMGILILNKTIIYHNKTAYQLTYKYKKNNSSLVYSLIIQGKKVIPVDPYIRLNNFKISAGVWIFKVYGESYNIYLRFNNYNNAKAYENYIIGNLQLKAIITDIMDGIFWIALGVLTTGWVGVLVAVAGTLVSDLAGVTNPLTIAHNVKTLFKNEWGYSGNFRIVFTENEWENGALPEFAVWGRINPGNSLFEVFRSFQYLTQNEGNNFVKAFGKLAAHYGLDKTDYISNPKEWRYFG